MSTDINFQRLSWIGLIVVILLGAFLRLEATIHTVVVHPLRADAAKYFTYAFNLRHFGVYSGEPAYAQGSNMPAPDAIRSPGYSLSLVPFAGEMPTDRTVLNITLMQAVLGVLAIPFVFVIAGNLLPAPWPLLPAFLAAISPQLITAGTYALSEALFTFLLLLSVISLIAQFRSPDRHAYAILSGVLLGLASLTRPTLQYFVPFVILAMLPLLPNATRLKQGAGLLFGFVVAITPWLVRNMMTLGIWTDSTLSINTLVHGHYPEMMYAGLPESSGYPYRHDPDVAKLLTSTPAALAGIWERALSDPPTYLYWYLIQKPISFLSWGDAVSDWDIFTFPTQQSPYYGVEFFVLTKSIMQTVHWALMALSISSVAFLVVPALRETLDRRTHVVMQLMGCIVVYFLAIHIVGLPSARYNYPLLPIHYVLATCVPI
jgi:4-amino-4-deoxy-L-arabinose transferase-like glycosyltransferase